MIILTKFSLYAIIVCYYNKLTFFEKKGCEKIKSKQVIMESFVVMCVSVASAMGTQSRYQPEWLCNITGCSCDRTATTGDITQ